MITLFFIIAILNIIFLIWWRTGTEWKCTNIKFPTRGHIVIIGITSFVPIANAILFAIIIGLYIGARESGDLKLKHNKFNKYWFDIDDE